MSYRFGISPNPDDNEGSKSMSVAHGDMLTKLRWYEAREHLLTRINPELTSVIDVDKFLKATVIELGKLMEVDKCHFIVIYDQKYLRAEYEYVRSSAIPSTRHLTLPLQENGWDMDSFSSTVVINDTSEDSFNENLKDLLIRSGTRSLLLIPVKFRDEFLGILAFHYCTAQHAWSEDEVSFLTSLTQQMSIALQYARLYTRMEKEGVITKYLLEITNDINTKMEFADVTSFVLMKVVELLNASHGSIGILDTEGTGLRIVNNYPDDDVSTGAEDQVIEMDPVLYKTILDKRPVSIVGEDAPGTKSGLAHPLLNGAGAAIFTPIVLDDMAYGTLNLFWDTGRDIFNPYEIELLAGITNQMALVLEKNRLYSELKSLKSELQGTSQGEIKMVGMSRVFEKCVELAHSVTQSDVTVLLHGETGTGKELIADFIHRNGDRRDKRYIKINCGAIPENLIESELFGYEKGAFTGAETQTIGKFELASGGTIFLDEVGELSLNAQVKLLRVLQDGEIFRVGGAVPVTVDVRVIAATNIDLEDAVAKRNFRLDLFYRLNVFPIYNPPLRERAEDIPLLVLHFLDVYKNKTKKLIIGISDDAMELLKNYVWMGNVRELENVLERAVITCSSRVIRVEDLPENIVEFSRKDSNNTIEVEVGSTIDTAERQLISETLRFTSGDKKRAAGLLGITRKTLYRKLKAYGAG